MRDAWAHEQQNRTIEVESYDDGWTWRKVKRYWRHDTIEYELSYLRKILP